MNVNQAEALLEYLEFHLLSLVEDTEKSISDPNSVGDLYDRAYDILRDFENTLGMQVILENGGPLTSDKNS